jgi:hypothetical protein
MPVFRPAPPAKVVVGTGQGGCRSSFLDVLDATTIADITMNPKTLLDRLESEVGMRAQDVA